MHRTVVHTAGSRGSTQHLARYVHDLTIHQRGGFQKSREGIEPFHQCFLLERPCRKLRLAGKHRRQIAGKTAGGLCKNAQTPVHSRVVGDRRRRNAELHSAVSQILNLRGASQPEAPGRVERPADCMSVPLMREQIENLRYGLPPTRGCTAQTRRRAACVDKPL
jgi:hypothetical protein